MRVQTQFVQTRDVTTSLTLCSVFALAVRFLPPLGERRAFLYRALSSSWEKRSSLRLSSVAFAVPSVSYVDAQ